MDKFTEEEKILLVQERMEDRRRSKPANKLHRLLNIVESVELQHCSKKELQTATASLCKNYNDILLDGYNLERKGLLDRQDVPMLRVVLFVETFGSLLQVMPRDMRDVILEAVKRTAEEIDTLAEGTEMGPASMPIDWPYVMAKASDLLENRFDEVTDAFGKEYAESLKNFQTCLTCDWYKEHKCVGGMDRCVNNNFCELQEGESKWDTLERHSVIWK